MSKFTPWNCATCGKHLIGAMKTECPHCGVPRPGSPADLLGSYTVTYEGQKAMMEGITAMGKAGWVVQSQSAYQPRAGLGRIALLGVGALVFKPGMKVIVTFTKKPTA